MYQPPNTMFFVTNTNRLNSTDEKIVDSFTTRAEAEAFAAGSDYQIEEADSADDINGVTEGELANNAAEFEQTQLENFISGTLAAAVAADPRVEMLDETLRDAAQPFLLDAEGEAYMNGGDEAKWPHYSALSLVLADEYGATDIQWWHGTDGLRFTLPA